MEVEHPKESRADFLLGLFLSAVMGFNLVLVYKHAMAGDLGWFLAILVLGVLIPGTIPFMNFARAAKMGIIHSRWRDLVAAGIGAMDSLAILAHWPKALEHLSWVSIFIIGSVLAFILLAQTS